MSLKGPPIADDPVPAEPKFPVAYRNTTENTTSPVTNAEMINRICDVREVMIFGLSETRGPAGAYHFEKHGSSVISPKPQGCGQKHAARECNQHHWPE